MRPRLAAAAALILCLAVALGAVRRVGHARFSICGGTDEYSEFMPGLRLHALPLWNVDADIRSNFFKSLAYSPHGFGDSMFYYLASAALHGLGLSISDRHLWLASAFTNALLLVVVAWLGLRVARSPAMAYVVVLQVALSTLYVVSSQTMFARVTFVPLLQVGALVLAARTFRSRTWPWRAALLALTLFIEMTDGFYFGPVLLLFLALQHEGTLLERALGTLRDRLWWQVTAVIAVGLGIDAALGALAAAHGTTLTLFGYVRMRLVYGGVLTAGDLFSLWLQAFQKYIPIIGPAVVIPAWLITIRYALADPLAGTLAVWFFVASSGPRVRAGGRRVRRGRRPAPRPGGRAGRARNPGWRQGRGAGVAVRPGAASGHRGRGRRGAVGSRRPSATALPPVALRHGVPLRSIVAGAVEVAHRPPVRRSFTSTYSASRPSTQRIFLPSSRRRGL